MMKEEALQTLESYLDDLKGIRAKIQGLEEGRVRASDIIDRSRELAIRWFETLEPMLHHFEIAANYISNYHDRFDSLLRLTTKQGPAKTKFIKTLDEILDGFSDNLVVEVQKYSQPSASTLPLLYVDAILKHATEEETDYLLEALNCVRVGARRAAVIMGWCAAVYRMHKKIESLGFDEFNKKSKEMKNKTTGRYKRFNKSFGISSLYELRATIFDSDLLWVLEYWELIDSNQHHRLSTCYVMRSSSAHPGEAKISDENLISFFSDLRVIVFENSTFQYF